MTSVVDPASEISRVTIGALDDMGYIVDYAAADDYTRSDLAPECQCGGRELFTGDSQNLSNKNGEVESQHRHIDVNSVQLANRMLSQRDVLI